MQYLPVEIIWNIRPWLQLSFTDGSPTHITQVQPDDSWVQVGAKASSPNLAWRGWGGRLNRHLEEETGLLREGRVHRVLATPFCRAFGGYLTCSFCNPHKPKGPRTGSLEEIHRAWICCLLFSRSPHKDWGYRCPTQQLGVRELWSRVLVRDGESGWPLPYVAGCLGCSEAPEPTCSS
jgi:hypothetical protein